MIRSLSLGLTLYMLASAFPAYGSDCEIIPKELLRGPRRHFSGLYENGAYQYSILIPKGFRGYDVVNPFYQRGVSVLLGAPPHGLIETYAEPNSTEAESPGGIIQIFVGALRRHGKEILSSSTENSHLGKLDAVRSIITYRCTGSPAVYVEDNTIALSPDRGTVFEVTLHTTVSERENDLRVLEKLLGSWRFIGP